MLTTTKKPILLALLIVLGSLAGCIGNDEEKTELETCLLYTSPSPRDAHESRMPSSA